MTSPPASREAEFGCAAGGVWAAPGRSCWGATFRRRGKLQHGAHLTAYLRLGEAAGGQLNGERGRARQVVVLPVGGGAGKPWVMVEAHPGRLRVDATGGAARSPGPDEVHVLVVPDRHVRADAQDEVARESRLAFGKRRGPG